METGRLASRRTVADRERAAMASMKYRVYETVVARAWDFHNVIWDSDIEAVSRH